MAAPVLVFRAGASVCGDAALLWNRDSSSGDIFAAAHLASANSVSLAVCARPCGFLRVGPAHVRHGHEPIFAAELLSACCLTRSTGVDSVDQLARNFMEG